MASFAAADDSATAAVGADRPIGHAFHHNLPEHCIGPDGVPYVTRYAEMKARSVLKLARSIVLTERAFMDDGSGGDDDDGDDDDDEEDTDMTRADQDNPPTMIQITRMCNRLSTKLSGLEDLKHLGLTHVELCEMLLRVLRLLSATVTFGSDSSDGDNKKKVQLRFDDMGELLGHHLDIAGCGGRSDLECAVGTPAELEQRLSEPFALPSPARQALLNVAVDILSKKGWLLAVSNVAIAVPSDGDSSEPKSGACGPARVLVIHWQALLRMLLRTAPYLDEHQAGLPPKDSSSRSRNVLRRTVEVIRSCRRFFDQGVSPTGNELTDITAESVWRMVKDDIMHHSHSNAYFRGVIFLYLFCPSRCSSNFYRELLPIWLEAWNNVDRCPELDYLWLVMFCRARKHTLPGAFDWGQLRRRLLTQCGFWLQIPLGGTSSDKSFPVAAPPRVRSLPLRLKVFVGSNAHQEGIDFVRKLSKVLVFCIGMNDTDTGIGGKEKVQVEGQDEPASLSSGTDDLLRFFAFVAPYFHPSNTGAWTYPLGLLLHYLSYDLCRRLGLAASIDSLNVSRPDLARGLKRADPFTERLKVPECEIVAILDAFVPLCQQALYSKMSHVGRAAESAMLFLAHIDPIRVCPPFLDLAARALDISSATMSHQAPAALSALNRLVQPSLRRHPPVLLRRLPDILRLSLAGIDSNDQNKSIRTLAFYRNLTSWLPVGNVPSAGGRRSPPTSSSRSDDDGTLRVGKGLMRTLSAVCEAQEYKYALASLPEDSLLRSTFDGINEETESNEDIDMLLEETALAMSDWALAFLDRVYLLLHAAGEQEKRSKHHGVASRHSSADVANKQNFGRVLKETMVQVFAAMDQATLESAIRSVVRFLQEETLAFAAKDSSNLCQAVASARHMTSSDNTSNIASPGLDALVPILIDDLPQQSSKTATYRLRCLAGAVKYAGKAILNHRDSFVSAIDFAFAHSDRHVFKTGCKLLRHTLASQCEAYPISSDCIPRLRQSGEASIGRSSQLRDDHVIWHVPSGDQIDFAVGLLQRFVVAKLHGLAQEENLTASFVTVGEKESGGEERTKRNVDALEWRRTLRIVRYSLRGCSGILLDPEDYYSPDRPASFRRSSSIVVDEEDELEIGPHVMANRGLVLSSSSASQTILKRLRVDLCIVIGSILSVIASETRNEEQVRESSAAGPARSTPTVSSDAKFCKEVIAIAQMLLTRRSAPFRCVESRKIVERQKELTTDFALRDEAEHILCALQRASLLGGDGRILYKDGEDGGKTVPRRILVTRVYLFHQAIQREATYSAPRRLRRIKISASARSRPCFQLDASFDDVLSNMKGVGRSAAALGTNIEHPKSLDVYEGMLDGLVATCCLSNAIVRGAGLGSLDYSLTRFGWETRRRVPRLLSSISLQDSKENGKYGVPSCALLSTQTDPQGKHKRFAEVLKGVSSIVALPRMMKEVTSKETNRLSLIRSLCGTQSLISLLPAEETQKLVAYFQKMFDSFQCTFFLLPRITAQDQKLHESLLLFLLDILSEKSNNERGAVGSRSLADKTIEEIKSVNWQNRLTSCWLLMSSVDERDLLLDDDPKVPLRLWSTCAHLLSTEMGQPIQRVALGTFGRLVSLISAESADTRHDVAPLCDLLLDQQFCTAFANALVFDHSADTSVAGGHHPQWSSGVVSIIRDASVNLAPTTLFPFQRFGRSSPTFKVAHAQLVQAALVAIGEENALISSTQLLKIAVEMAGAPPSEDQRNQVCTAAEIFSGVSRSLLELCSGNLSHVSSRWSTLLLPFLADVVPKIPMSQISGFYDAVRFAIHHLRPKTFFDLTTWLIEKVEAKLWQSSGANDAESDDDGPAAQGQTPEGFTAQSKWLSLICAVLDELDDEMEVGAADQLPWYAHSLIDDNIMQRNEPKAMKVDVPCDDLRQSWRAVSGRLLPRLLFALGHPYEKIRENIAGCLFRICYCHRKFLNTMRSRDSSDPCLEGDGGVDDPGKLIVEKLVSIMNSSEYSTFKMQRHALITARKFMVYCVHVGDCKNEFSEFVIPLIPLAFEGLTLTLGDKSGDVDPSDRMLEAEVVKGFRYQVAEVSCSCPIIYGRTVDIDRVIDAIDQVSSHDVWQIRQAAANALRCIQGGHKFVFSSAQTKRTTMIVSRLLVDDRREVSAAAMAALTGILAAMPLTDVTGLVRKQVKVARKSIIKKKKKKAARADDAETTQSPDDLASAVAKEKDRARSQQTSVLTLCASVLANPYDTPSYVPLALAAISKHSFEGRAPLAIRETVKRCCAEFKKTHTDNWEAHKKRFSQEQLDALDDVISSPHYYS